MQVECIPSSDAISVYATEMNKFLDDMYKSLLGDSSRIHTHDRIMFSLANAPVRITAGASFPPDKAAVNLIV